MLKYNVSLLETRMDRKEGNNLMYEKLTAIVGTDRVKCNEQMKNHTTFRIGGPADFYIESISTEELQNRNNFV